VAYVVGRPFGVGDTVPLDVAGFITALLPAIIMIWQAIVRRDKSHVVVRLLKSLVAIVTIVVSIIAILLVAHLHFFTLGDFSNLEYVSSWHVWHSWAQLLSVMPIWGLAFWLYCGGMFFKSLSRVPSNKCASSPDEERAAKTQPEEVARREALKAQSKMKLWSLTTVAFCVGAVIGGLVCYCLTGLMYLILVRYFFEWLEAMLVAGFIAALPPAIIMVWQSLVRRKGPQADVRLLKSAAAIVIIVVSLFAIQMMKPHNRGLRLANLGRLFPLYASLGLRTVDVLGRGVLTAQISGRPSTPRRTSRDSAP